MTVGGQAEIGWALDPAYQGRGLALEAARRLMALCFDDLGIHRVIATCFADNETSWRLMEKLGMRREAHNVKESLHRERGWLDTFTYALLEDEWSASPGRRMTPRAALNALRGPVRAPSRRSGRPTG